MGAIRPPLPVKLIVAMFTGDVELFARATERLVERFGSTDFYSGRIPFDHTDYYEAEFGTGLVREVIAFQRLVDPGTLADVKVYTNALEEELSEAGGAGAIRRRINIDPGYIEGARLVLASTKNHGHRIYIGRGIYAEVTLLYTNKGFQRLPWSYPDYASDTYRAMLREIRATYLTQLGPRRQAGRK